jgi:hypothetical protein
VRQRPALVAVAVKSRSPLPPFLRPPCPVCRGIAGQTSRAGPLPHSWRHGRPKDSCKPGTLTNNLVPGYADA